MSQINIPFRVSGKLKDQLDRESRFRKMPRNRLLVKAVEAYLSGETTTPEDERNYDANQVDPLLLRMFSDDKGFDILDWVTDEPGRGETAMNINARVRAGTVRIIDTILAHPNCPYTTKSDFIRDAVLTTAYVAAKGRLHDDRVAEFARRERILAQVVMEQGRFRMIEALLNEIEASVKAGGSEAGNFSESKAIHGYKQVCRILREEIPQELDPHAMGLVRWLRKTIGSAELELLDEKYDDIKKRL